MSDDSAVAYSPVCNGVALAYSPVSNADATAVAGSDIPAGSGRTRRRRRLRQSARRLTNRHAFWAWFRSVIPAGGVLTSGMAMLEGMLTRDDVIYARMSRFGQCDMKEQERLFGEVACTTDHNLGHL